MNDPGHGSVTWGDRLLRSGVRYRVTATGPLVAAATPSPQIGAGAVVTQDTAAG